MPVSDTIQTDVCIIGAGLAGLAATLFAANRGLACVQVGSTGEINFSSGFFDLLGVHPIIEKNSLNDPWAGIDALVRDTTGRIATWIDSLPPPGARFSDLGTLEKMPFAVDTAMMRLSRGSPLFR